MTRLLAALTAALLSTPAAAVVVTVDEHWGATSDLWDGRRLAICIQPGAPSPTGSYWYALDTSTAGHLNARERRALALADELPKADRETLARTALAAPGEADTLPAWAWVTRHETRALVIRSSAAQDLIILPLAPPALEPPTRYAFTHPNSGMVRTAFGATHSVSEPPAWALLLGGTLALAVQRTRTRPENHHARG